MKKLYVVRLTDEERVTLKSLIRKGRTSAAKIKKAYFLLKADVDGPNFSDVKIAEMYGASESSVRNLRKRFVEEGLEASLERKPYYRAPRIMDGNKEAHLIALACGKSPEGHARWTLRLLAEKFVELEVGVPISHETVRCTLKKMHLNLISKRVG